MHEQLGYVYNIRLHSSLRRGREGRWGVMGPRLHPRRVSGVFSYYNNVYGSVHYVEKCFFVNVTSDILDRALQEPVAKPHPLSEDGTNKQSGNLLEEPLPGVTSLRVSVATAVGVAERALSQSSQLRHDLDCFLSTQSDAR